MWKLKFFLFLFFVSPYSFAQVKVDSTVEKRYKMAFKKMKPLYQQQIIQLEKTEPYIGVSIFTYYKVDTLNRKDFIDYGKDITVENTQSSDSKRAEKEIDENIYTPIFSIAKMANDNLELAAGTPFPPTINHKIYLNQVTSYYEEYFKYDSVLRLKLNYTKVSKLLIPIQTKKFLISTSTFKAGQLIYGQVEFETLPYYFDTFEFKEKYIKKRLRCTYFFKVRIKKNST